MLTMKRKTMGRPRLGKPYTTVSLVMFDDHIKWLDQQPGSRSASLRRVLEKILQVEAKRNGR